MKNSKKMILALTLSAISYNQGMAQNTNTGTVPQYDNSTNRINTNNTQSPATTQQITPVRTQQMANPHNNKTPNYNSTSNGKDYNNPANNAGTSGNDNTNSTAPVNNNIRK